MPNATIMMIENAERFGCHSFTSFAEGWGAASISPIAYWFQINEGATRERLHALCRISNGFELSEQDLKLRGPGFLRYAPARHTEPENSELFRRFKDTQGGAGRGSRNNRAGPGLKSAERGAFRAY